MNIGYLRSLLTKNDTTKQAFQRTTDRLIEIGDASGYNTTETQHLAIPFDDETVILVNPKKMFDVMSDFMDVLHAEGVSNDEEIRYLTPYFDEDLVVSAISLVSRKDAAKRVGLTLTELTYATMAPHYREPDSHSDLSSHSGLFVINGKKSSGKSTLIGSVLDPSVVIRRCEQFELAWDTAPNAIMIPRLDHALLLVCMLGSQGEVCAIDSLKNEVYRLKGSLGSQGISNNLMLFVSELSSFLSVLEAVQYVSINPSMKDDSMEFFDDQINGNAFGSILLDSPDVSAPGRIVVKSAVARLASGRQSVRSLFQDAIDQAYEAKKDVDHDAELKKVADEARSIGIPSRHNSIDLYGSKDNVDDIPNLINSSPAVDNISEFDEFDYEAADSTRLLNSRINF